MLLERKATRAVSREHMVTRWKPVDLGCAMVGGELIVRTKLIRCPDTAAVCIAEAISAKIVKCIGLLSPECFAIAVDPPFAKDLTRQYQFPTPSDVIPGHHFGTELLGNRVLEVEWNQNQIRHTALIEEKADLFRLFLADVILANPDRRTVGNVLIGRLASTGPMRLIAIDHSDCFGHPSCFRDPARLSAIVDQQVAEWLVGTESVILDLHGTFPESEIARVSAMEQELCEAVTEAPEAWYEKAGIDPEAVRNFLKLRIRNLADLAQLTHWTGIAQAVGGGIALPF